MRTGSIATPPDGTLGLARPHLGEPNRSRHLTALEAAGYIRGDKVFERKRARTWLSLTPEGRRAFVAHVAALQRIVTAG